jgi:hypothetical protein
MDTAGPNAVMLLLPATIIAFARLAKTADAATAMERMIHATAD